MNLRLATNVIPRRCTAQSKRSGERCRKSAMKERAVCLAHGGKTPRGVASPNLRHGRYSKAMPFRAPSMGNGRINDVPSDRQCGAKTRAGMPCKNWGRLGSGRCRMHGGSSPIGIRSPSFKHGWYSRYAPWASIRRQAEQRGRLHRGAAARIAVERARRADKEARETAKREKQRRKWEPPHR